MKFKAPRGMRDYYPDAMAARNWIMERWHRVSLRNGFEEYDGPIMEELDLFRVKSGEGIVSELFHFADRGGREMAIRPEMTPTLARMVAARANALRKPIKWYSVPRLCRAERPQRGRLREFFQWNIDILGEDDILADAECIFVAIDFFRDIGLTPEQVVMKISSRSVLAAILRINGFAEERLEAVYATLDKRDKLAPEEFSKLIETLGVPEPQEQLLLKLGEAKGPEGITMLGEMVGQDPEGNQEVDNLERLFDLLGDMGVGPYCLFDMGVVRGLAYYTGPVFEAFGKGGLQRAICGGGRYGELLKTVGGPPMSGVGFGSSDVVIADLLKEFNLLPDLSPVTAVFVIDADPRNPTLFKRVLSITAELRRRNITASYSYRRQGIGKQFKQANDRNARRVIIVEEATLTDNTVSVKDMGTGVQQPLALEAVLDDPFQPLEPA
ncbi:MAG: histidine--tRNA ligase [Phycisphaerae bacterium]|nr:histidine--tRNA ligase [Phycisphaerae bacterium]